MDLVDFSQMVLLNDGGGFAEAIFPTKLKLGVCQGYEFLVMEYEQGDVIAVNVIGVGVLEAKSAARWRSLAREKPCGRR